MGSTLVFDPNSGSTITIGALPVTLPYLNNRNSGLPTPVTVSINSGTYNSTSNSDGTVSVTVNCSYSPADSSNITAVLNFRVTLVNGVDKINHSSVKITFTNFSWNQGIQTNQLDTKQIGTNIGYYLHCHIGNLPADIITKTVLPTFTIEDTPDSVLTSSPVSYPTFKMVFTPSTYNTTYDNASYNVIALTAVANGVAPLGGPNSYLRFNNQVIIVYISFRMKNDASGNVIIDPNTFNIQTTDFQMSLLNAVNYTIYYHLGNVQVPPYSTSIAPV